MVLFKREGSMLHGKAQGLGYAVLGVVVLSPNQVITDFAKTNGVDELTLLVWTLSFAFLFMAAYLALKGPLSRITCLSKDCGVLSLIGLSFTSTILLTSLNANSSYLPFFLYPLWVFLFGRIFLHDTPSHRTIIELASSMVIVFLLFAFSPQVSTSVNICALLAGITAAIYLTAIRSALSTKSSPLVLVGSAAGLVLSGAITVTIRSLRNTPAYSGPYSHLLVASMAQGFFLSTFLLCCTLALEDLSGIEMSMVSLLELILSRCWPWLLLHDTPPYPSILGGVLLLLSLLSFAIDIKSGSAEQRKRKLSGYRQVAILEVDEEEGEDLFDESELYTLEIPD